VILNPLPCLTCPPTSSAVSASSRSLPSFPSLPSSLPPLDSTLIAPSLLFADSLNSGNADAAISTPQWSYAENTSAAFNMQKVCTVEFSVPYDLGQFRFLLRLLELVLSRRPNLTRSSFDPNLSQVRLPLLQAHQLVRLHLPFVPSSETRPGFELTSSPPFFLSPSLSYQNHRRYVKSVDANQLHGDFVSAFVHCSPRPRSCPKRSSPIPFAITSPLDLRSTEEIASLSLAVPRESLTTLVD